MSPYILPVCGCPEARPRGVIANVEDIRGHILRVSGVYLAVTHALGDIKCTITELGVYASIYTPSYQPIRLICNDVLYGKEKECMEKECMEKEKECMEKECMEKEKECMEKECMEKENTEKNLSKYSWGKNILLYLNLTSQPQPDP